MSKPEQDVPLRVFRPSRTLRLIAKYAFAGLFGLGLTTVGVRMLYEWYAWAVGNRVVEPQALAILVAVAFFAFGVFWIAVAGNILFRPGSICATVYRDRIVVADGFLVRRYSLSEIAETGYESTTDGGRTWLYLTRGGRREIFALQLVSEAERDECIELVNRLLRNRTAGAPTTTDLR
jgi:hypothetical protein